MIKKIVNLRGQIWIETVLYTVITLVLIGVVLSVVNPKINESKDRLAVEQSIQSLSAIDEKINAAIDNGPYNVRVIEFTMKRGSFLINSETDDIEFLIEGLTKPYSEPGVEISYGKIKILSTSEGKTSSVILKISYAVNITSGDLDVNKKLNAASTPYKLSINNKGKIGGNIVVDISE